MINNVMKIKLQTTEIFNLNKMLAKTSTTSDAIELIETTREAIKTAIQDARTIKNRIG